MRKGVLSLSILLTFSLIPAHSSTPPKTGSTCSKQGISKTYQGKKFTCIKSGKKLVWNKGVDIAKRIAKPSSSPSASPNKTNDEFLTPKVPSSDIENCKVKEVSPYRTANSTEVAPGFPVDSVRTGFPWLTPYFSNFGTVKMAVVPIDFVDLPGEPKFEERILPQMSMFSDWISITTNNLVRINWSYPKNWIHLPWESNKYSREDFWSKTIPVVDSQFDLSGVQVINFILPQAQKIVPTSQESFPWRSEMQQFNSSRTHVLSFTLAGNYYDERTTRAYWAYWAHEFGHALGFAHIGGPGIWTNMHAYDIEGSQDGPTRDLSGWSRFVAGWLNDKQIYCMKIEDFQSTDLSLIPLNETSSGIKLVGIRISKTKILLIESRRPSKFACSFDYDQSGVLAYVYDATKGHREEFLSPLFPSNYKTFRSCSDRMPPAQIALLQKGDRVQFEGLTIEILESKQFDTLRISKN